MQANGRACTPVMCFRRLWMMRLPLPAARYIPQVLMAQGEAGLTHDSWVSYHSEQMQASGLMSIYKVLPVEY